jgi:hypothetical protein
VRGWLRRFAAHAEPIRVASLRLGPRPPWPFAARVSGGRLLAPVAINPS